MLNNSMVDYSVKVKTCNKCYGSGRLTLDRNQLRNYIDSEIISGKELRDVVRDWKAHDGVTICRACEGYGTVDVIVY